MSHPRTTIAPGAVFSPLPDIVPRQIAGDTILVPVRGELARLERIFVLNAVGEHIWGLLDGHLTVAEVCAKVVEAFEVDEATAQRDVMEFLADLEDAELVTCTAPLA